VGLGGRAQDACRIAIVGTDGPKIRNLRARNIVELAARESDEEDVLAFNLECAVTKERKEEMEEEEEEEEEDEEEQEEEEDEEEEEEEE
jgi:hypothetical protein